MVLVGFAARFAGFFGGAWTRVGEPGDPLVRARRDGRGHASATSARGSAAGWLAGVVALVASLVLWPRRQRKATRGRGRRRVPRPSPTSSRASAAPSGPDRLRSWRRCTGRSPTCGDSRRCRPDPPGPAPTTARARLLVEQLAADRHRCARPRSTNGPPTDRCHRRATRPARRRWPSRWRRCGSRAGRSRGRRRPRGDVLIRERDRTSGGRGRRRRRRGSSGATTRRTRSATSTRRSSSARSGSSRCLPRRNASVARRWAATRRRRRRDHRRGAAPRRRAATGPGHALVAAPAVVTVVPGQRPGRRRPRDRGAGRAARLGRPRVLGRARHPLGAPVQRVRHRAQRAPGRAGTALGFAIGRGGPRGGRPRPHRPLGRDGRRLLPAPRTSRRCSASSRDRPRSRCWSSRSSTSSSPWAGVPGLVRVEDIVIGVTVSVVVGLVFWPRRAEVTLRHVTVALYRALAAAAGRPDLEHRRAVRSCERRAEAAYTQYLADTANDPDHRRPWDVVLGASDTARNGLRFYEYDLARMRDAACPQARDALDAAAGALRADWVAIADAIAATTVRRRRPATGSSRPTARAASVVSCLAAACRRDRRAMPNPPCGPPSPASGRRPHPADRARRRGGRAPRPRMTRRVTRLHAGSVCRSRMTRTRGPPSVMPAVGLASQTVKVSSPSTAVSPAITTGIVCCTTPGAKVRVTLRRSEVAARRGRAEADHRVLHGLWWLVWRGTGAR